MKAKMKTFIPFLLIIFLLTGCSLGSAKDRDVTTGKNAGKEQNNQIAESWTAARLVDSIASLEQENYILQHLAFLEGDEYQEVLSVKSDLAGQASLAYEESQQAKVNKVWMTISDACMYIGDGKIELTNEYDILLTELMQSSAAAENFQESYEEAYCDAVKELLSGISSIMKDSADAAGVLKGSSIDKVKKLTASIDKWIYLLEEANGKERKEIMPLFDDTLEELKKGYEEALGDESMDFLKNVKSTLGGIGSLTALTAETFGDFVDEYLFYRAASVASEEWYRAWKQIAQRVEKDGSDEAKRMYESLSSILEEIETGKETGWEQTYLKLAKRNAAENLAEYCLKTAYSTFEEVCRKWQYGEMILAAKKGFSAGVSLSNSLMNCDDIAYYGQMVLGAGILARNTYPVLLDAATELSQNEDYESALYFDEVFHIIKDIQIKGCDYAIAFHQAIIENPVGYTLKYMSDDHVTEQYLILADKADWQGYECHGKVTDYYRFIHDTLLPELGYVNTDEMTNRISVEDYFSDFGKYQYWDERSGLLAADIADLNNDGTDDLIVYYFDPQVSPDSLMASVYSRNDRGEIYLIGTEQLGDTSDCEEYHYDAGLIPSEDGLWLYTEEHVKGKFTDYSNNVFTLYQLTEDGRWIQKYRMGQSGGGTSEISYSLWTYVDEDTYEETILWADSAYRAYNGDAKILTAPGTDWSEAIAYGFDIMGLPEVTFSYRESNIPAPDNDYGFRRTLSYDVNVEGSGTYSITSVLADNTNFRENMKPYETE